MHGEIGELICRQFVDRMPAINTIQRWKPKIVEIIKYYDYCDVTAALRNPFVFRFQQVISLQKAALRDFPKLVGSVSSFACRNWFCFGIPSRSSLSRLEAAALHFALNCFPTKLSIRLRGLKIYNIVYLLGVFVFL